MLIAVSAAAKGSGPLQDEASQALSSVTDRASQTYDFDIPAQPLVAALQRYGNIAKKPALYRSEIVDGQISSAIKGRYTAQAALRLLLAGTGLTAEKFNQGSDSVFILKTSPVSPTARAAGLGSLSGYPALLQNRVWRALCDNPRTRPGEYRALLRFFVDTEGRLQRVSLVGSTGNASQDTAIVNIVQHVQVGGAPPVGMPQPVVLLLLPHQDGFNLYCNGSPDSRARQ